ncbi:MAG: biotin carboxylase N-terminal domain-containing protein [Alphaproteobacteria bacterium]
MPLFRKILIANRGEIACRIARTCHRLGIPVVGIHSIPDRDSLAVRMIGESIEIGGATPTESYLNIEAVLGAAKRAGADAIHPGFGFLSENAAFARAVEAAGITFIGPSARILERFGDKAAAKQEARAAGVPVVPGSVDPSRDPNEIQRLAQEIGLPVMLKAAAGGGGRGMRIVNDAAHLGHEVEAAMREAKGAFGDDRLIVEKLVTYGRHIEVQIAGDGNGNVIHLYERECTLQRRHQKVIEEAPAPNLPVALRARILDDACRLAARDRFRGLGTVEFILTGDQYYFLEVNPRLQVEHPVTESVTGLDLIEIQLRAVAGHGLAVAQESVRIDGHAVEARVYAEDPAQGFMPSTGRLAGVHFPPDIRVETGVDSGSEITPYYDAMIAKLITHAPSRDEALDRMDHALAETAIFGITTNIGFLRTLVALPETRSARFHTTLIDEGLSRWATTSADSAETRAIAAYLWLRSQRASTETDPWGAWNGMTGWQVGIGEQVVDGVPTLILRGESETAEIRLSQIGADGALRIGLGPAIVTVRARPLADGRDLVTVDARQLAIRAAIGAGRIHLHGEFGTVSYGVESYLQGVAAEAMAEGRLLSPMMGTLLRVNVNEGDSVKSGDIVAVLESMKLEMRIVSPIDGIVTSIACKAGDKLERGQVVAVIDPPAS